MARSKSIGHGRKRTAPLSSLATRVKARAMPMKAIVREIQAFRRGGKSSAAIVKRILSAKLRLPAGETAESVVRRMRDRRYGPQRKR